MNQWFDDPPRDSVLKILQAKSAEDRAARQELDVMHKALSETTKKKKGTWKLGFSVLCLFILIIFFFVTPIRAQNQTLAVIFYPSAGVKLLPLEMKKTLGDTDKKYERLAVKLKAAGYIENGSGPVSRKCEVEEDPLGYHVSVLELKGDRNRPDYLWDASVAKPDQVLEICRALAQAPGKNIKTK